jgi:hypothetical protein
LVGLVVAGGIAFGRVLVFLPARILGAKMPAA